MSSFRTKAFTAVFTIFALTFGPYAALAQNSWTPPTQAPTGGNVPAPVNVGASDQTKLGPLTIKGAFESMQRSTLSGDVVTQPDTGGFGFMANFLESFFYNNVQIGDATPFNGSGNEIPVDLSVYGKFKYQTADSSGNPEPVNPGYVLVTNDEGYTEWVDPATITGGAGNLPNGVTKGETLYWDPANGGSWKVATNVKINPNVLVALDSSSTNGGLHVLNDGSVVSDYRTAITGELKVTLDSGAPTAGQVLESADNQGNVTWGDGLPSGGNNGDVLTWNSTTNQWESTTINIGTGNLPDGTSTGQSLRWTGNPVTGWQPTDAVKTPSASTVQIGADAANSAVMIGNPISTSILQVSANTLNLNPDVIKAPLNGSAVAGKVLSSSDNMGTLAWTDLSSLPGSLPAGTLGQTLWNNGTSWQPTSKLIWNGTGDILKFEGSGLLLKGENGALNPAEGRFLQSKDDQGEVTWNKYFVYNDIPYNDNGVDKHIDSIEILESDGDDTRTSGFANYGDFTYLKNRLEVDGLTFLNDDTTINGMSSLNGDTTVTTSGDLFLEGIETSMAQLDTNGNPVSQNIKDLCIRMGDYKVVLCGQADPKPIPIIGEFTEVFGPSITSISFPRLNQAPGPVTVEACGGGGGGGGGGYGQEDGSDINGTGGGGGGGGQKGECSTHVLNDTDPGDVLSVAIGNGGGGGAGGEYDAIITGSVGYNEGVLSNTTAVAGANGGSTTASFNGTQILNVYGGLGGQGGRNAIAGDFTVASGRGCGGAYIYFLQNSSVQNAEDDINCDGVVFYEGGNVTIPGASAWFWNNGNVGYAGPGLVYGAAGGHGDANNVGQGGYGGQPGSTWGSDPYGGHGGSGSSSHGGGGGGGGGGRWYDYDGNENGSNDAIRNRGGSGSSGGDGYIKLTYSVYEDEPELPTDHEFLASGTFNLSELPSDSTAPITFEVWGAGGGGGGAGTATPPSGSYIRRGGGGGAGGYGTITVNRSTLPTTGTLTITVGNGGAAGTSTTSGGNGGQTAITGGISITVEGGEGGSKKIYGQGCVPVIAQGGDTISGATLTPGGDGGSCGEPLLTSQTGYGASGQGTGGFGGGGSGGAVTYSQGMTAAATAGQPGRVLISW